MSKRGEYKAFAALARAQGQRDAARYWQGLVEAEQKRLQWEAEQNLDKSLEWPCHICGNLQGPNVNWQGIPANCHNCGHYVCGKHGKVDAEGNIWCEKCECTDCENGCDQCLDPLMAGYEGCYHKDLEKCNCAEEYRLHQKWVQSSDDSACTCSNCQQQERLAYCGRES